MVVLVEYVLLFFIIIYAFYFCRKFYKIYGNKGVINFDESNDVQTPCQKFLDIYLKLKSDNNLKDDELMSEAGKIYESMQLELETEQMKEKANTLVVPKLSEMFKKGLEVENNLDSLEGKG